VEGDFNLLMEEWWDTGHEFTGRGKGKIVQRKGRTYLGA
jgi:hypothetical protein